MTEQSQPIDPMAFLNWPTAMLEEAVRFPETMKNVRLLFGEQVRLLQNLNEATEILLRVAHRLENSDIPAALSRVEAAATTFQDTIGLLRSPITDPVVRIERMERTLDEMRERFFGLMGSGARQAVKAYESWARPEEPIETLEPDE
jgi:hypothetical protein